MDPQGRLLGRGREVIANSVHELREKHRRWRVGAGMWPTGFDVRATPDGQFELICKAGDIHQSCGTFPTRDAAMAEAQSMVADTSRSA